MQPFRIQVPQSELDDLRSRLLATRWPEVETEAGWAQGVPLEWMRDLVAHWVEGYDWREREARLNSFPQVLAPIDGLTIHAVHLRSPHPEAVPLVMTHGWPGSFAEYLKVAGPLVDPPTHGGDAVDAVHLVLPSLPGYAFSSKPDRTGWGVERVADAWVELMGSLGYPKFAAAGSDWGTSVSAAIGERHPAQVLALTLIPPLASPDPATRGEFTHREAEALRTLEERESDGSAYSSVHQTRPQTIGYALVDSPVGLAAWIAEKWWSWCDPRTDRDALRDDLLDAVMIYWLTRSGASSARLYRESIAAVSRLFREPPRPINVPVGGVMFPCEAPWISRRWAQQRFPDLRVWSEPDRGGHFGALENPDAVIAGIRDTLRTVRTG